MPRACSDEGVLGPCAVQAPVDGSDSGRPRADAAHRRSALLPRFFPRLFRAFRKRRSFVPFLRPRLHSQHPFLGRSARAFTSAVVSALSSLQRVQAALPSRHPPRRATCASAPPPPPPPRLHKRLRAVLAVRFARCKLRTGDGIATGASHPPPSAAAAAAAVRIVAGSCMRARSGSRSAASWRPRRRICGRRAWTLLAETSIGETCGRARGAAGVKRCMAGVARRTLDVLCRRRRRGTC